MHSGTGSSPLTSLALRFFHRLALGIRDAIQLASSPELHIGIRGELAVSNKLTVFKRWSSSQIGSVPLSANYVVPMGITLLIS